MGENAKMPISRKWPAAEQNGVKFGIRGVVQEVYVQFVALWPMAKFHAQIWQCLK